MTPRSYATVSALSDSSFLILGGKRGCKFYSDVYTVDLHAEAITKTLGDCGFTVHCKTNSHMVEEGRVVSLV